ncbi:hypothetical protein ON010_g16305 [Phytophthora cinnamomi]|nr:hypothetical protein ON010_g16305 [Phytophthora cinnamomi]
MPSYSGHGKRSRPSPDYPPKLSRQQQAEAKRWKIKVDSHQARGNVAPTAMTDGEKEFTARQEHLLNEPYRDYVRKPMQAKRDNRPW